MFEDAYNYLSKNGIAEADLSIILGSGLGGIKNIIKNKKEIKYKDIPGLPTSTVKGHDGSIYYGQVKGINVVIFSGRFHYYEGYKLDEVTSLVHLSNKLGVKSMVVTNAAGGVNSLYNPGDIVLIKDHMNFTGLNPLISKSIAKTNKRFVDMTDPYSLDYRKEFSSISKELKIEIKEGTYFWMTGPSYESKAEIAAIKKLGGDLVGMSTVPEVIIANYYGIKVLGISCVTNMAAGMQLNLDHNEVIDADFKFDQKVIPILTRFIENIKKY